MKPSEFVALQYLLKHAKSKKAVINSYPELKGKTIAEVESLIAAHIMATTGKIPEQQRQARKNQKRAIIRKIYGL